MEKRKCASTSSSKPASKKLNIEDAKVSLLAYSQSVINAAMKSRKKYQQDYRKKIQLLRPQLSVARESEVKALHVFPEEVWNIILGNIKETDALRKCVKADPLFQRILSTTKFLFEEVFPFLTAYLSKRDVLSCSHVCSKWRSGVESFLANYHRGILETRKSSKLDCFQAVLNFDENPYVNLDVNFIRDSELLLPGGVVTISKFYHPSPLQMPEFDKWFDTNGDMVRHVTLNMKLTSVNVQQLYLICSKLAEKCPHLESLYLSGGQSQNQPKIEQNPFPREPPKFPSLEFLKVSTQCEKLLVAQDILLKNCSSKLKQLSISSWNTEIYNNLLWNKLQQLDVLGGNAMQVLQSLEKLYIPNLGKLHVRLDSDCQNLTQLFRTINSFPNLHHLSLTLTENCTVWSETELVKMPLELVSCNRITTLEIITKPQKPNRDFLVYFPLVRYLVFRYGKAATRTAAFAEATILEDSDAVEDASEDESSEDDLQRCDVERFGDIDGAFAGLNCFSVLPLVVTEPIPSTRPPHKAKPAPVPQFMDMTMFCKTNNPKDFYKSSIWKIMPLLTKLELQCVYSQPKGYRRTRPPKRFSKNFHLTRQGYAWEIEEMEQRQKMHVEKVRKEARLQIRQQRDAVVQELAKSKVALEKGPKSAQLEKQRQILVQEKAWSLVLKTLTKSDILTCRLVSKSWKYLADKQYLPEKLLARDWIFRNEITGNEKPDYDSSDFSDNSDDDNEKKPKQDPEKYFKENFDKPFFARITEARLRTHSCFVNTHLTAILESLADKMEDLSITSKSGIDVEDFFKICVAILRHCPNLRNVSFYFTLIDCFSFHKAAVAERYLKTLDIHRNLESITLLGPHRSCHTRKLIKRFSTLLPQFSKFPNLKHLNFGAAFAEKWINLLEKMFEAPGLETMRLRLGGDFVTVEQLIKLVNKFPKLTSLNLEFYGKLGGLGNLGVVYTQPSCISTRINKMKVTMGKKEEVSLDFLIHFPFLRKLCIAYGSGAAPWDKKIEYDAKKSGFAFTSDAELSESETGEKKKFMGFREPEKDFVQLVQYFGEKKPVKHNKEKILDSNIWTVLDKLESLEVTCVLSKNDKKHNSLFTRKEQTK